MNTLKRKVSRLVRCLSPNYVIAKKRDIVINGIALGIACRLLETYSNLTFDYWAAKVGEEAADELKALKPEQVDALLEKCAVARKKAGNKIFFALRGW